MRDRREEILARIVKIASSVAGVNAVHRNVSSQTDLMLPAIILRDGDEEAQDLDERAQHRYAVQNLVTIHPELYVLAKGDEDTLTKTLGAIRMALIKEIPKDATLKSICGEGNGNIRYSATFMKDAYGVELNGAMRIQFQITYPLLYADFA